MSKATISGLFVFFLLAVGCLQEQEYPIEPYIEFHSYTKINNQNDTILKLSLQFRDGDGDIGLLPTETVPPYDYNFYITLLRLRGTQLNPLLVNGEPVRYNSRIPMISPTSRNKAIKGVIEYSFDYSIMRSFLRNDTICFEVYIRDRALHTSNVVKTPLLLVN